MCIINCPAGHWTSLWVFERCHFALNWIQMCGWPNPFELYNHHLTMNNWFILEKHSGCYNLSCFWKMMPTLLGMTLWQKVSICGAKHKNQANHAFCSPLISSRAAAITQFICLTVNKQIYNSKCFMSKSCLNYLDKITIIGTDISISFPLGQINGITTIQK